MKFVIVILLFILTPGNDLDKIAKANKLKKEAKVAYQSGDFSLAIEKYRYLLDSMKIDDDKVRLNMANAYYQLNDTTEALNNYGVLTTSDNKLVQSTAHQQLGVMQHTQEKYKESLSSFKQALKADPTNEDARYNYELLKKIVKEQEEQQKDQQQQNKENQDQKDKEKQQKQDQQNQENKEDQEKSGEEKEQQEKEGDQKEEEKEGEEKEQKEKEQEKQEDGKPKDEDQKDGEQKEMPMNQDKLKKMQITEEKAKMILEAMKNNEVQYIQQNRRKAQQPKKSGKPDW